MARWCCLHFFRIDVQGLLLWSRIFGAERHRWLHLVDRRPRPEVNEPTGRGFSRGARSPSDSFVNAFGAEGVCG